MTAPLCRAIAEAGRTQALALACLVEPGTPGVAELVSEHGVAAALARIRSRRRSGSVAGRLEPEEVPLMLAEMARRGVRVVLPGEPEFPSQLLDLPEPPLALWVSGPLDLRVAALRSVSVVGARACTAYGERATGVIAGGLGEDGWAVVSGAAFGIDAAAHRAALAVGGQTVAVLACGVDLAYPRAHDALLARIADSGLVVSELPPGSQPLRHRFLARNRVIAALSRGTVVAEAARRSGAVATASRALELGRVVMAVPGPITSMASSGTNRLLHEQSARAVSDSTEVLSLLVEGGVGPGLRSGADPAGADPAGADPAAAGGGLARMSDGARAIHAVLPGRGARGVESVAAAAGVAPASALAHLGLLELAGLARRTREGWRRL